MDTVVSGDVMEANVNNLLRGERVAQDFLPSQGCSIKWKQQ
jgi:hypothetical protein